MTFRQPGANAQTLDLVGPGVQETAEELEEFFLEQNLPWIGLTADLLEDAAEEADVRGQLAAFFLPVDPEGLAEWRDAEAARRQAAVTAFTLTSATWPARSYGERQRLLALLSPVLLVQLERLSPAVGAPWWALCRYLVPRPLRLALLPLPNEAGSRRLCLLYDHLQRWALSVWFRLLGTHLDLEPGGQRLSLYARPPVLDRVPWPPVLGPVVSGHRHQRLLLGDTPRLTAPPRTVRIGALPVRVKQDGAHYRVDLDGLHALCFDATGQSWLDLDSVQRILALGDSPLAVGLGLGDRDALDWMPTTATAVEDVHALELLARPHLPDGMDAEMRARLEQGLLDYLLASPAAR